MTSPTTLEIISEIQRIRYLFYEKKDKLISSHNTWSKDTDARITLFQKFGTTLCNAHLGLVFIELHLSKKEWWDSTSKKFMPDSDKQLYINNFMMFVKMGFLQFTFSSIESSFRLFVKSIEPTACDNGTAEFKSIYAFLFKKLNLQKWEPLLDLFRCARNTIHNNGVYFHRLGKDEAITYKGTNYYFQIGLPINFVDWIFLINLMEDINKMLYDVVTHPEITKFPSIIDPFF